MSAGAVDALERARAAELVDERGKPVTLRFAPPLPAAEIDALARELDAPLPHELRAVLEYTSGIDGPLETIDFTGRTLDVEVRELFPAGLPIAHDGYGNFWVLDLRPGDGDAAAVFFTCHDPPVALFQSPDLGHFLHETFRMLVPPHSSLVDDVHEDRLFAVWRTNPATLDHATALAGDEQLRAFAAELDARWTFVDLRAPEIGMGFSWGRHGPRTDVRRHGYERLFAYAPPERKPGLRRRLFG